MKYPTLDGDMGWRGKPLGGSKRIPGQEVLRLAKLDEIVSRQITFELRRFVTERPYRLALCQTRLVVDYTANVRWSETYRHLCMAKRRQWQG